MVYTKRIRSRRVKATELLEKGNYKIVSGKDFEVSALAYDSRKAVSSSLFFALPGAAQDGKLFAQDAIKRGAGGVVFEGDEPQSLKGQALLVKVSDARRALARAAHRFFGDPTSELITVGVTGTDGKTTTTYLLESIFRAAEISAARFGTIEYSVCGNLYPALNTTPESLDLVSLFAEARACGAKACTFEVSSHALAQKRADFCQFDCAIFTGFARDHLDYHGTLENYFQAKKRLFTELLKSSRKSNKFAVINTGSPEGKKLADELVSVGDIRIASVGEGGDVFWESFESNRTGVRGILNIFGQRRFISSLLIGDFNATNIAVASCAAYLLGIDLDTIARGVGALGRVAGRMEPIFGRDILVLIDYSHTPDALAKAIGASKKLNPKKLTVVFGCGGDRDRGKRPLMGKAAAELADRVVVTSDNPRTEDPVRIIDEIIAGMNSARRVDSTEFEKSSGHVYCVLPDRTSAIELAISQAISGEIVLIAGKGHETYQVLGTKKIHFDDREKAREAILKYGRA